MLRKAYPIQQKKKDALYVSSETEMIFTDLTSTEVDVEGMQDKSRSLNVIEDIPIFMGDDSKPENYFPTFYIHSVNECLSLWTGDAEDYMYEINLEMCLFDDFNGPKFQTNIVQSEKRNAKHKFIIDYQIASRVKVENPPEWHAIFGIREVTDSSAMDIWIQRAHIDHFIIVHQ